MSNFRRRLLLTSQTDKDLYLYGNSVQDGIPTPENPIDIVSIENPIIKITSNNLFNKSTVEMISAYFNGSKWTYNSGSASIKFPCEPNKTYTISGNNPSNTIFRVAYIIVDDIPIGDKTIDLYNPLFYTNFNQPAIITTGDNAKFLVIQVGKSTWDMNIEKLQIKEGVGTSGYEPYTKQIITIDETTPFGNNVLPYPYYDTDKEYDHPSIGTTLIFNSTENDNGQVLINGKTDTTDIYYCTEPDSNNVGLLDNIFQDKETYSIKEVPIGYKIISKSRLYTTFDVDVSDLYELVNTNEDGAKNYIYTSYDNVEYKLGPIGGTGAHRTNDGGCNIELLYASSYKRFTPDNDTKNANSLSMLIAAPRFVGGTNYTAALQKVGIKYSDNSYESKYVIITSSISSTGIVRNGGYDKDRISRFMVYVPKKDINGVELDLKSFNVLSNNCKILSQTTDIGLNRELTLDDIEFSGDYDVIKGTSTPLGSMVYGSNYEANRAYPVNGSGYVNSITLNLDKEVNYIDYNIEPNTFNFDEVIVSGNLCYVKVNIPNASDEYAYYARFSKNSAYSVGLLAATYNINNNYNYIDLDYNRDVFATFAEALEYGVFENKINSADYEFPNKDLSGNELDTKEPWFGRKGFNYVLKSPSDIIKRPYIFLIDAIDGPSTLTANAYSIPPIFYSLRCIDKSTKKEVYYRNTRFTVDKSKYLYCDFRIEVTANYNIENTLTSPMIQKGIVVGEFEKYKAPVTTMRGVGNYRDKIYTKDGKVYYEQMMGVFENDSSDEFGMATRPTTYYYFQKPINALPAGLSQTLQRDNPGLCNYFKYDPQLSEANSNFIWTQNTAIRSAFKIENVENVEDWVADKTISTIYPIVKQEPIEITGPLAEQILNIDKDKNITIYSNNGIYGNIEIIQ